MQILSTRKAGQKGTRQLQLQYGDALVCVRYRYDKARRRRVKTVELVVEERAWAPVDEPVLLKVSWGEKELGIKVKRAGGEWLADKKLWRLPYGKVLELGLGERVIGDWEG